MKLKICTKKPVFLIIITFLISLISHSFVLANNQNQKIILDVYNNRKKIGLCPDALVADYAQKVSEVIKVNQQEYIVIFYCFLAAYQPNFSFVKYVKTKSGNKIQLLKLDDFQEKESGKLIRTQSDNFAGLIYRDEKNPTILKIHTVSGCAKNTGVLATYKINGSNLKLLEYRAKTDCTDVFVKPENYPLIYTSK